MEETLRELGITERGEYARNNSYVITLGDSDDFSRYYARLDKNPDVEELTDSSQLTLHDANVIFKYEDLQISLQGNFDTDEYKLVATKY